MADDATVGDSLLAHRFYAGQYAEIVAETFDADAGIADVDTAFVVGALTFVDRVDEARGLFDGWRARAADPSPRTIAAGRFFLGLAAARAGYFDRSQPLLVGEAFRARHDEDPWVRAFVFQGLACQCYFTGRYPAAAAHALRALQSAHEAKFLYIAMLGTDLRGHALVQVGQLQRGVAMLEQAGVQARRLGLTNNAFAVDTSIATYVAQFDPHAEALDRIESLLRRRAHDSYSRRALLTEAAIQYALRGRRSEAVQALEDADRDALRGDTRRGKVTSLLARIAVTRWQRGPAACAPLIEQARPLVEPRDIAFRARLLGFEIASARATGDLVRAGDALAELRGIWRASHHFLAKSALVQAGDDARASAFDEDGIAPHLRAVARRDLAALSRIAALGFFGVVPELLGLEPARRIIWIPAEELMLLEDCGDVVPRERVPRWCPVLLRLLASGAATKERIVHTMWGIRAYHPELHDPPVRTTIHRLRTFLAPFTSWITVGDGGYRSAVPIHVVGGTELGEPAAPVWEEGRVPDVTPARAPSRATVRTAEPKAAEAKELVLARLDDLEQASVPQLARALELSASTVLRALRELVAERRVERLGFARATRYRPAVTR
ncbi:MAG: hypothetical protein KF773_04695 [Deltaproteobacteria bacterium]|nr:hypothetical protein [Deltaproteobacteria bacterium]